MHRDFARIVLRVEADNIRATQVNPERISNGINPRAALSCSSRLTVGNMDQRFAITYNFGPAR